MKPERLVGTIVLLITAVACAAQEVPVKSEAPVFRDFTQRVQDYVKQQKAAQHLRTTKKPDEIVDRRHGLAEKIRETRPDAKQGDIFTPEISADFRRVIRSIFEGPKAPAVRKTIRQGEPQAGWHLSVNAPYPEHLPLTTVPPTLLQQLPRLPKEVSYRIIGHDFVLQDTEARVVIDFIPGALP